MAPSNNSLDGYFPELDFGIDTLSSPDLHHINVSVFDHWLSQEEAADIPIMSYSIAHDEAMMASYLHGEEKFLRLYRSLSKQGVLCNSPTPARNFDEIDDEIEQIFVDSLREKRAMDVFFKSHELRVIGRYDRTDLFIARDPAFLVKIREEVAKAGLFVLA
ncbi:hypothetical protein [Ensifer adhaerens]|uniref:hypothetical protein n=1 Tax=Ensifer adhaerens TaxID=106592 RepID=UPI000CF02E80|nr:hypothetical protein [Ensifer adhaerens]